jgi:hypothetical protein
MAFDEAGNLYVTNFDADSVSKLAPDGTLLGPFGTGYLGAPESIIFDANGDAFVGHADGTDVQKRSPTGSLLDTFDVLIDDRGSDWIQLKPDGRTLVYTSEGTRILQYDLQTHQQLADFGSVSQPRAYGIALLPNGEAIVAANSLVRRFNAQGAQVATYDVAGNNAWFAIGLDPDGTSFWVTDGLSSSIYRFSISGGQLLNSFPFGAPPGDGSTGAFPVGGVIVVPDSALGFSDFNPPAPAVWGVPSTRQSATTGGADQN